MSCVRVLGSTGQAGRCSQSILHYGPCHKSKDKCPYKRQKGKDAQKRGFGEITAEPETGVRQAHAIESKASWPFPRLGDEKKDAPKAARERGSVNTAIPVSTL